MTSELSPTPNGWDARGWGWLLGAPRLALRPVVLLPVWIVLNGAALSRGLLDGAVGEWALPLGASVLVPLLGAWVCAGVSRVGPGLGKAYARRLPPLLLALGITLVTPFFFLAFAYAGGLLGRIPGVGVGLVHGWALTVGLGLAVLAAGWAVVAIPSLLLQVPAATVEYPHALDVVSRSISYVRNRPMRLCLGWGAAALGAVVATAPFLGFLFGVLWALQGLVWIGEGTLPDLGLTAESTWRALVLPETWWPFGGGAHPPASRMLEAFALPFWIVPLGRLAPAYLFAAFWAGTTRVYLLARQEMDGTAVGQVDA